MLYRFGLLVGCLIIGIIGFAQEFVEQEELGVLPDEIDESSGLICVGDSLFVTLNDSGSDAVLYVINEKAELVNRCEIRNAKNVDWETLTTDGKSRIFIGDIGNNENKRKDLAVYTVHLDSVLTTPATTAEKIAFTYPDQTAFPPVDSLLYFDAEAMVYANDSLFIFTKNRTVPFDGIAKVYGLSTAPGEQVAQPYPDILLRPTHWTEDCITGATLEGDTLYLLTYSKIYKMVKDANTYQEVAVNRLPYPTQIEAICYRNGYLYITDEKTVLGMGKLYRIRFKD